jgi:hypothetical protein
LGILRIAPPESKPPCGAAASRAALANAKRNS